MHIKVRRRVNNIQVTNSDSNIITVLLKWKFNKPKQNNRIQKKRRIKLSNVIIAATLSNARNF